VAFLPALHLPGWSLGALLDRVGKTDGHRIVHVLNRPVSVWEADVHGLQASR